MIRTEPNTPNHDKPTLLIDNVFSTGTVTVSSETADGSGANALGDGTYDYWTAAVADANIAVDMGSAVYCDGVGIAAHTLATDGATLLVQSSTDDITWTTRLTVTPTVDETILGVFQLVLARYWRIRVTGGPASIGVIKLGRRVIIPTGIALGHIDVAHSKSVELLSNDSVDGQFLNTRVIRQGATVGIDFGLLPRDFVEGDFAEFETGYNEGKTFFYAGGPSILPTDVGYCKRPTSASELRIPYSGGDLMQVDLEAQVYVG